MYIHVLMYKYMYMDVYAYRMLGNRFGLRRSRGRKISGRLPAILPFFSKNAGYLFENRVLSVEKT